MSTGLIREPPRPRVVIVAPVHVYDDVRVFQKEAKTLARHGYDVRLIARAPAPLVEDGVTVVPVARSRSRLARFARLPVVLKQALAQRGDIYHLHNPDTLPLAVALRLMGKRVVYDTHEDFSLRLLARDWIPTAIRPLLAGAVASAEGLVGRMVTLAIATQSDVCARLSGDALLLENAPIVSGPLIDEAHARARQVTRSDGACRLVYVGTINPPRGLYTMLDALVIANEAVPVRLWLVGPFTDDDQGEAERHPGWSLVDYLGAKPQAEAFAYLARADLGMVTLLDVGGHSNINPNKLFEYQVFGVPFIASDFAAWRRIMGSAEAGLFVDPGNPAAVAAAIVELARDPDRRARFGAAGQAFVARYNWETESERLLSAYARMLPPELTPTPDMGQAVMAPAARRDK